MTIFLLSYLVASPTSSGAFSPTFSSSSQYAAANVIHRTLNSSNPKEEEYFGSSVAVSGNIVVVGGSPFSGRNHSSLVYVFSAATGNLIETLASPDTYSNFGESVAASGRIVVVGAPGEEAGGHYAAGHAYIFNVLTGRLIHTLTSPNAQKVGVFGSSVSVSGNIVVVGAPGETVNGYFAAGHAYIF